MAGYTRQATFTTGNVVSATDFTNEFDELLAAFSNTAGHAHDGTAAEGPVIGLIGDAGVATPLNKIVIDTSNDRIGVFVDVSGTTTEQVRFQDGAIVPVTDSDVDLGTSSLRFKDLHIDSIAMLTTTVTDILDEDDMTSDSATALATQQSIKAYVDANTGVSGSLTFVGLTDTPSSLSSDGGKMVKVNSGGTALEFVTADTDAIAEGSSNQYHTTARARAAVSVASNAASGGGSLSYDSSTGVFTFTPADVSSGGGSGSVDYAAADDTVTTAPSASGTSAIALGYATTASGSTSVALGHTSTASGASSISIGANSAASSGNSIALGELAIADQSYSAAIGTSANTSADNQLMLGSTSAVTGFTSIRVGNTSYAPSDDYDLTTKTYVDSKVSTDIAAATTFISSNGTASAGGINDIAIGPGANTNANTWAIAIGSGAEVVASNTTGIAIGKNTQADRESVAIGDEAAAGDYSIAIGDGSTAAGTSSINLGGTSAAQNYSVALGKDASTTASQQLMLGSTQSALGFTSVRVGNTSYAPSNALDLTPKNYVDTQVATKAALTDLSVTEASASGGGGLAYNSSTGTFTFTPSTSSTRTFVRYSRYYPSTTPALTFDPSTSGNDFELSSNTGANFMVSQAVTKDGNSGNGITVTSVSGVEGNDTPGNAGDIRYLSAGYIELTNNSGSPIYITGSGELAVTARLTNRSTSTGFVVTLNYYLMTNSGFGEIIAFGGIYANSSSTSLTNASGFIHRNFASVQGTLTDNIFPSSTWGEGQTLRFTLGVETISGNLDTITGYDFDIELLDLTLMYDSDVSNYSSTTTSIEGIKLLFAPAGDNYATLNSEPATGDNVVGFYEGSSASSTASDYDWTVYAPLPTTNLTNDDVLKYDITTGWTYGQINPPPPTTLSKFAAATKTIYSSTFEDVGTLMTLNDGHQGAGEALVSITKGGYVQTLKVTFVLTSSGVDFTSYSAINTGSTQYGFIDVVFDSGNGGTAKLQGKVVPGHPCIFTFHVTQL